MENTQHAVGTARNGHGRAPVCVKLYKNHGTDSFARVKRKKKKSGF